MNIITGKIHVRDTGVKSPNPYQEGHTLVSMVSVMSVPTETIENDRMYVVTGHKDPGGAIQLTLTPAEKHDSTGWNHGQLLLEPIWQV